MDHERDLETPRGAPAPLRGPGRASLTLDRPRVVGILNVTPDSFSDGGQHAGVEDAVAAGLAMARDGAAMIDVGGESTRPGAGRISATDQCGRVVPVIEGLRAALDDAAMSHVLISIDTTLAEVAGAAVDAGASVLNDVAAGREDAGMFALAAERSLPLILMHMQGQPGTMQDNPTYDDVVSDVHGFLLARAAAAVDAGVTRDQIVLDPGIGFGKTLAHNLRLLATLDVLVDKAMPGSVMLGASRKRFIAAVDEQAGQASAADQRVGGTAATTTLGVAAGVALFRVHDVPANRQAADVAHAIVTA